MAMTNEKLTLSDTANASEQPSKYMSALISSVNDGAKAVQSSNFALCSVGLYLAAASISINDEDIFRGSSFQISQLGGVSIPIIASFILGPIVFLLLHIQLLLRYRILAESVCALSTELHTLQKDARTRCLRLVASVDFVRMILRWKFKEDISSSYDRTTVFLTTTLLPLAVLLVVQISFVRYQNIGITYLQTAVLLFELGAIGIFHYWLEGKKDASGARTREGKLRHGLLVGAFPAAVAIFSLIYVQVPAVDDGRIRFYDLPKSEQERSWPRRFFDQPLDMVLCPEFGWGCRHLRLNNRKLVGTQTRDDALWKVLTESRAGALAAIDGLSLRERTLRYANFNGSRALKVDLVGDDLRHASFWNAAFQGASLSFTKLQGADLERAQLQEADLTSALLTGANLRDAQLQGADLELADLRGADLTGAQLVGANLNKAQLQGASLERANLRYANLQQAEFNHTAINVETRFDFADMRNVNFHPKEADAETTDAVLAVGLSNDMKDAFTERMRTAKSVIVDETVEQKVYLTLTKTDSIFSKVNNGKVIEENEKYLELLEGQPVTDPVVASGLVRRAIAFSSINDKNNVEMKVEVDKQRCETKMEKIFRDLICHLHEQLKGDGSNKRDANKSDVNKSDYVSVELMRQLDALSWQCRGEGQKEACEPAIGQPTAAVGAGVPLSQRN
ncbi:pentapeptide repeat-containing protein [Defluviicoccus vanus]|uniref:Pentapeptide repeat-containing protein n=1 Tax=Defluviicoccus vanus TaxID=111831 RepID=A0A7H1N4E3_9PROT|nr:pentapeptide repeat-containing protein [Defluviicoccus vanus]QNT70579.1 pentapeptide repeat-containing protein [Defluviicoccus vanus]